MIPSLFIDEIVAPTKALALGSTGIYVKRLQEWLGLRGIGCKIDGEFGPATERACRQFFRVPADVDMIVDQDRFKQLISLLIHAAEYRPASPHFGDAIIEIAEAYLSQHPREAGGDNRGPWVRHFCRGHDGPAYAWCLGFANTPPLQAATALGISDPGLPLWIDGIWPLWVPRMAAEAKQRGLLLKGSDSGRVPVGSYFFLKGGQHGYYHTGLVVADNGDVIETIEGNTNDDGSANGYEVCRRFRKKSGSDYGLWEPK